jgi:hypothetical protein
MRGIWRALGPGLITGAADDDPSGIATYSQAGASALAVDPGLARSRADGARGCFVDLVEHLKRALITISLNGFSESALEP